MEIKQSLAITLWLETAEEVRYAAYLLKNLYEDDMMDDPDLLVHPAGDLAEEVEEMDSWYEEKQAIEWLSQLQDTLYDLSEEIPVQFRLTDDMKFEIDSILPEMYIDEDNYMEIKETAERLRASTADQLRDEIFRIGVSKILPEFDSDKAEIAIEKMPRSALVNLLMQYTLGDEEVKYPFLLFRNIGGE